MNFKTGTISQIRLLIGLVAMGALLSACTEFSSTPEGLKAFLSDPVVLLFLMYFGALGSILTTVATAKRDGSDITYLHYLTRWETIVAGLIAVPITWGTLLFADQLNFAAAAAYGAIANTAMDKFKSGGRSSTLMTKSETQEP